MIEGKLEKRRKNVIGAPVGKRVIIFVDDLNMPKLDTYGSQPPIELLRQYQDFGGMYDREKLFWKEIQVRNSSVYISFWVTYTIGCLAEQTLMKHLSESSQCLCFQVSTKVSKHLQAPALMKRPLYSSKSDMFCLKQRLSFLKTL